MIFWTPDVTPSFLNWSVSTTEQIVCCQTKEWNGTDYPDLELRLSDISGMISITLFVHNDDVEMAIDTIWKHVSANEELILSYIEQQKGFRREVFYQQYKNGEQLDLGIYDCIDLLSLLDEKLMLFIRISDSIERHLLSWLNYAASTTTNIKILVLNSEGAKGLSRLKNLPQVILPQLSRSIIVETCSNAIHDLTGTRISDSELYFTYSNSSSLKEFITHTQAAILYQITPQHCSHWFVDKRCSHLIKQ